MSLNQQIAVIVENLENGHAKTERLLEQEATGALALLHQRNADLAQSWTAREKLKMTTTPRQHKVRSETRSRSRSCNVGCEPNYRRNSLHGSDRRTSREAKMTSLTFRACSKPKPTASHKTQQDSVLTEAPTSSARYYSHRREPQRPSCRTQVSDWDECPMRETASSYASGLRKRPRPTQVPNPDQCDNREKVFSQVTENSKRSRPTQASAPDESNNSATPLKKYQDESMVEQQQLALQVPLREQRQKYVRHVVPPSDIFWITLEGLQCLCLVHSSAYVFSNSANILHELEPNCNLHELCEDNPSDADMWSQLLDREIRVNAGKVKFQGAVSIGIGSKKKDRWQAIKLAFALSRALHMNKKTFDKDFDDLLLQATSLVNTTREVV